MENKELFALTCINDEPAVVSIKIFDTKEAARDQMAKDVATEEKSWDEDYTITTSIAEDYASMCIEENGFFYIWNIDKVIK